MPTLAPCLYPKAQVENTGSRSLGRCCSVAFLKQQKAEGLAVLSTEAAAETLREFPWQSGNDFSSGVLLGGLHLEEKEKLQTELASWPSLPLEALLNSFAAVLASPFFLRPFLGRIVNELMFRLVARYRALLGALQDCSMWAS